MSYPPPPGSKNPASSLPPRPPPSKIPGGFKPAFSSASPSPGAIGPSPYAAPPGTAAPPPAYSSAPGYPGATAAPQYGAPPSTYQPYAAQTATAGGMMGYGSHHQRQHSKPYSQHSHHQYPHSGGYGQQHQQAYYGGAQSAAGAAADVSYTGAPQIRNPFPAPTNAQPNRSDDYDPDLAAQIAQWQSAYVKDPSGDPTSGGLPGRAPGRGAGPNGAAAYGTDTDRMMADANAASAALASATAAAAAGAEQSGKKKTVVRAGGGQKWTDDTLLEWDPSHLRLFVGNLAGETTDESLLKAFSRWRSLQKARVIRDKVTSKSRGYGFVSFSDPDEFFQAAKEMNGKYIQSHPVVVRKSTTEIKPTTVRDKNGRHNHHNKYNKNNKNKNRGGSGGGAGGGGKREGSFEPHLGPAGGGVTKPGQKTKGGLKLLG